MLVIKCDCCGRELHRPPSHVKVNNFCDRSCLSSWLKKNSKWLGNNNPNTGGVITAGLKLSGKWVKCSCCNKDIWRRSHRLDISERFFCGNKCAGDWRRKHVFGTNHPCYNQSEVSCEWCGKKKTVKQYTFNRNKMFFCGGGANSECRRKWESKYKVGAKCYNYNGGTPEKRKVGHRMSAAMRKAIRQEKAGRHWESLVGYTVDDLIKRLKSTLPKGYSWEKDFVGGNGTLHIDHIIPMSSFNFNTTDDIDFRRCFALINLQLLPASENLHKFTKISKSFQPCLALGVAATA